jgi:endonuclease/exonuclease/phosphatase family metal-dependent hydrolase
MKIVSLNIWGGKAHDALFSFLEGQRDSTDIFCLQEVWTSPPGGPAVSRDTHLRIFEELSGFFSGFSAHFYPVQDGLDLEGKADIETTEGHATFVKNALPVLSEGEVFVHRERNAAPEGWDDIPASFGYVRVPFSGNELTVMNFHGIPFPGDKLDTPARLWQSRRLLDFMEKEAGDVALLGDFNLLPETESIRMLEGGYRNLITEYGVKNTRSRLSPYYGKPDQQFFADFAFLSPEVGVLRFDVPEDCVASDHLPLILEIEEKL